MKFIKLILVFFVMYFINNGTAQEIKKENILNYINGCDLKLSHSEETQNYEDNLLLKKDNKPVFLKIKNFKENNFKNNIWVKDSTYYYTGEETAWVMQEKEKVIMRDAWGYPINTVTYFFNETNNTSVRKDTTVITYFNNHNIKTILQKSWNNSIMQWTDTTKFVKFNENGDHVIDIERPWNYTDNEFDYGANKRILSINNNLLDSINNYWWDKDNNKWKNENKVAILYDENENPYQYISLKWNKFNKIWDNKYKSNFEFDNKGNMTHRHDFLWHEYSQTWVNAFIEDNIYLDDNLMEHVEQQWDHTSEQWFYTIKLIYDYDDAGNRTQLLQQYWAGEWKNNRIRLTQYNEAGNITQELKQVWNVNTNRFENFNLATLTYNSSGNRVLYIQSAWDKIMSEWKEYMQIIDTYNIYENIIKKKSIYLNPTTSNWDDYAQIVYAYDTNQNLTLKQLQFWNTDNNIWDNSIKQDFFWSEYDAANINNISDNLIMIYPNPAINKLFILSKIEFKDAKFKIYSTNGKILRIGTLNQNEINVDGLPKGVCFLKIEIYKNQIIKKFIKQ